MAGIDLHGNNLVIGVINQDGTRLLHRKLDCSLEQVEEFLQTSGFGRIEAIGATIGVPRDIHVRPNVVGFGIPQMAKRTIAEDLGV